MAVTLDDVRHIAGLARLGLSDERLAALTNELNTILDHMEVLSRVRTESLPAEEALPGMPLRADAGPPDALARPLDAVAPSARDGFLLVPRLATHETEDEP